MAWRRSTFCTGLPSAFFQPLRFQPGIHLVTELMTYCESHKISRSSSASAVCSSRSRTALSSPMLLVPCGHPPAAHVSPSTNHAHPAGPGLDREEPSAAAMIMDLLCRDPDPGSL